MIKNILSQILDRKRKAVAQLRADPRSSDFRERALQIRANAEPHRLLRALESDSQRPKIIAEFKRRSPSAGILRADVKVTEVVRSYERGGACAISILTDEEYFGGSIVDLRAARSATELPLLRKDFVIDPIQVFESAIAGADAVLLIAGAVGDVSLGELRALIEDELGLDALVEVHRSEELNRALNAGARIIGVNNRDLRTFRTSLETSERLIAEAPRDRILISESGLQTAKSLRHLQALGFRGFLVGEALMRANDPETALRDLIARAARPSAKPSCSHRPVAGRSALSTAHSAVATARRSNRLQIKICGVTNANDARVCAELGADMIGLNFYPRSPRYIEPKRARQIVGAMSAKACPVGVFVDADPGEVRKTAELAGVCCVQLHGDFASETCSELAREFRVIRAFSTDARFHPEDVVPFPDCEVLLDAYHADLRGGTGQTCDWSAARATLQFTRFLILSGGLNAQNVGRAIAAVNPHAVDVCSGVESAPGVKDHLALNNFVRAVRAAERSLQAASTREPPPECHSNPAVAGEESLITSASKPGKKARDVSRSLS
jgi:indole-3-glycerol phosphate synthase/phosphoribosylanthranilate isomerase